MRDVLDSAGSSSLLDGAKKALICSSTIATCRNSSQQFTGHTDVLLMEVATKDLPCEALSVWFIREIFLRVQIYENIVLNFPSFRFFSSWIELCNQGTFRILQYIKRIIQFTQPIFSFAETCRGHSTLQNMRRNSLSMSFTFIRSILKHFSLRTMNKMGCRSRQEQIHWRGL